MSTPIRIYFGMDGLPLGGAPATTFRQLDVPWAGPSTSSRAGGSSACRRFRLPAFSARSLALDGVSWDRAARLKTQLAGDAAGYKIHAVVCSLPRASLLAGARCGLLSQWSVGLRRDERRSVPQHGVHDDGEATRQSDARLAHGRSPGDGEGPVLELELALVAGQHDVGGLIQQGPHPPVAAFRDAADIVDFPGLVSFWNEAQIGADISGSANARGII